MVHVVVVAVSGSDSSSGSCSNSISSKLYLSRVSHTAARLVNLHTVTIKIKKK